MAQWAICFVVFSLSCLGLDGAYLMAQGRPPGVGGDPNNQSAFPTDTLDTPEEEELDTANIAFFFPNNPGVIFPEKDSLLDNNFQQYDLSRRRRLDYFNLGSLTSAAYPSVYQPILRSGLDIGLHQFDIYQLKNSDIRFYHQTKPFTDVYYSGNEQTNAQIEAKYGRNFANGLNLSIDYKRVTNFGITDNAVPVIQRTVNDTNQEWLYQGLPRGRTVAFGVGFWLHKEKYDGYLTFTSNLVSQFDKGGITGDSVFRKTTPTLTLTPRLSGAFTRHEKYEIYYLHYLKLNRNDSLGTKRAYLVSHDIKYKSAFYHTGDPFGAKSSEPKPEQSDSIFYGSFITDPRGIRFLLKEKQIENSFNISTTRARISKDSTKTASGQSDWIEVGITHSFHTVDDEVIQRNFNNIILRGRFNFTPNDNLKVETGAQFNILGYNVGDYRLNGEAFFNLENIGSLKLKAISQLYEPTWLQSNLTLTQKPFWTNDFSKTLETHLSGTLAIPRIGLEGTVAYTLLNNYIYFDKNAKAQQANAPLSILQLIVNQNITLAKFHLDNTVAIQKPTETFLRLPTFYTKNSLYWEGKIFKKVMLTRIGADVRYNSTWSAPSYMPLTGQFFTQENGDVRAYPSLDVFLSFKVSSFRFFAKMENVIGSFGTDVYSQLYGYPVPDRSFRFGIRWQLLN
jgi:Putative porin